MAATTTAVPMTMAATVEQLEARHKLWGAKIGELEAAGESRRVQVKNARRQRLDDLKAKHRMARAKIDELKAAGSEKWQDFEAGVEGAAGELDTAIRHAETRAGTRISMTWIGALVLVVLWGVALITSYTLGGYIHVLLLPALVIVGLRLIRLRRIA